MSESENAYVEDRIRVLEQLAEIRNAIPFLNDEMEMYFKDEVTKVINEMKRAEVSLTRKQWGRAFDAALAGYGLKMEGLVKPV